MIIRQVFSFRKLAVAGLVGCVVCVSQSLSQAPAAQMVVRVHVADSSGAAIDGADVSIVRGLSTVLSRGSTDERGDRTLSVSRLGENDEIVVRKIGFQRVSRFFPDSARTASFTIVLPRTVHALDTVKVAEQENVRRKSYFIDAEAIENSPRLIDDALDVVMKLRPEMIWSSAGQPDGIGRPHGGGGFDRRFLQIEGDCTGAIKLPVTRLPGGGILDQGSAVVNRPVSNVWVNGQWIRDVPVNPLASLKRLGNGQYISPMIASVLASIKPEHVAEMQYHSCDEPQNDLPPHARNAIMVRLKDGIGFDPGTGSFVIATRSIAAESPRAFAPIARLLGVFDDETGDPLVDVEVVEVATGTTARTTTTGTVSLAFLPAGESQLKIQHAGFAPQTLTVRISPADTMPLTVVLARAKASKVAPRPHHRSEF